MQFHLNCSFHHIGSSNPEGVSFEFPGGIRVNFGEIERTEPHGATIWKLKAVLEREPSASLLKKIEEYSKKRKDGDLYPHADMDLTKFVTEIEESLRSAVTRTARIIQWRLGQRRHANPFASMGIVYWVMFRRHFHLQREPFSWGRRKVLQLHPHLEEVRGLLSTTYDPIAHELLREATNLFLFHDSPRAALLMAVAAAEIGVKACISYLEPRTEWLITELPAPSLQRLLKDYLPQLKPRTPGLRMRLPEEMVKSLEEAARKRNRLAHARPLEPKKLKREMYWIVDTVNDLLLFFDLACGHAWAAEHLSPKLRGHVFPHVDKVRARQS